MYWTTPSGTRYQTGSPAATRSRQSVDEMAMAGTSCRVTRSAGRPLSLSSCPGRVTPTKWARSKELVDVLPGEDLGEGVGAGDEEQLGVGVLGAQVAQGVDRVGRAVPVDVHPTDGEARVGGRGDDRHEIAMLGGDTSRPAFCHGCTRGDEDDLVEVEEAWTSLAATRCPWWMGSNVPPITPPSPHLSIVIPMFNEEAVLPLLADRLRPLADAMVDDGVCAAYEIVAVDDGSTDATPVLLQRLRRTWPEVRVLRLRANAGHQAAISAGLARARGDYVVTLDADLQDPPEVIREMLTIARTEGVDVVYGVRTDRTTDSAFKRWSARTFYRAQRALSSVDTPLDAGDYRLMSRATVDAVNALPEHHRVLRFVVPALGFPSATVGYRRAERAAGESKYPLARMLKLSVDSVTGFSLTPLRFATWLGLIGGLAALAILVFALGSRLAGHTLPGWTSTVVIVSAVGAVQLLALGILGEYVGRMYAAMQGRPTYFVAHDSLGEPEQPPQDRV
jgi:glycosyltransferase involved in cell wall biosynthesis